MIVSYCCATLNNRNNATWSQDFEQISNDTTLEMDANKRLTENELFRPVIHRLISESWLLLVLIFAIHAIIRFGGLWNAMLIPLSMIILWPLPWLLLSSPARVAMGFKAPDSKWWLLTGPAAALAVLAVCAAVAWLIFGSGDDNWFTQHAKTMNEALAQAPAGTSLVTRFWVVTIPAMLFSPFAEEFFYRGFILYAFSVKWGVQKAMYIQAAAFAFVHLAHYGLNPVQPALIVVWLPSMFLTAMVFGWIVQKSGSIWVAVLSHSVFNLGMNSLVFLSLPELVS